MLYYISTCRNYGISIERQIEFLNAQSCLREFLGENIQFRRCGEAEYENTVLDLRWEDNRITQ